MEEAQCLLSFFPVRHLPLSPPFWSHTPHKLLSWRVMRYVLRASVPCFRLSSLLVYHTQMVFLLAPGFALSVHLNQVSPGLQEVDPNTLTLLISAISGLLPQFKVKDYWWSS